MDQQQLNETLNKLTEVGIPFLLNLAAAVVIYIIGKWLAGVISMAGGYTENAVLRSIKVIRGGLKKKNVISVNLAKLVKRGDMSQNIMIHEGDIVYVPRRFIASVNYLFRQILPTLYFTDLGVQTKLNIEKTVR